MHVTRICKAVGNVHRSRYVIRASWITETHCGEEGNRRRRRNVEEEEEEGKASGGSSCRETYPIVRLVTPPPGARYKSPSPARLEERYKRVATTFIRRADLYLTV